MIPTLILIVFFISSLLIASYNLETAKTFVNGIQLIAHEDKSIYEKTDCSGDACDEKCELDESLCVLGIPDPDFK